MQIPMPRDEALRLAALHRYAILDTPPEPAFDRITGLAAQLLRVPIAVLSLVDENRQWFKSRFGIEESETPRAVAFCAYTILEDRPMVVEDAAKDPRFSANALVIGPKNLRFYAGVPLKSDDGFILGSLSVLDVQPRSISEDELGILRDLSAMAADELELRLALLELQRAEQEREQSEELREMVFSAAELGICITTREGIFVDVNPAYCDIFGYSREQLIGRHFSIVLKPQDARRARIVHAAFFKRHSAGAGEWDATRQDGSPVTVYLTGKPFTDREGREFALTTVTDISKLKRMERQLRVAQKMDAIGRLAGGIAHDFNNLLTVILGYVHVLQDLTKEEAVRAGLAEILTAAERAAATTRQLLACSRQQPFETELLDLNGVLTSLEDLLPPVLGETIELVVEIHAPAPVIRADRRQIEQAILNLAVNAREAMPGGGRLTIRTGEEEVGAGRPLGRKVPPGRYVTLTIEDTGVGMNHAVRAHLFEPFFTTKESGKPAGFGLPTVYGIVRRFGGTILVESRPGRGSRFTIYLPEVGSRTARTDSGHAPASKGLAILIAESDTGLRKMLVAMLAGRGHSVFSARTGAEALRVAAHTHLDLVISDEHLPDMPGPKLVTELCALNVPGRALLMGAAEAEPALNLPGLAAVWVQKPFTVEQLLESIDRILRPHAA